MSSLEQRARMYAALGEPVRLALTDRLALGDVSPGQLSKELGMATNHLAHHLRALQAAGLIRRVRSEGDQRRNYVQLVLDDPLVVALTSPAEAGLSGSAERVVFICTRNSARSQLAAAAWSRASAIPGTSAGTHPAARVHPRAVRIGRRHGLNLKASTTADIVDVARPGDLLVAVCDNAHEELAPGQAGLHWAVPDPARVDTDQAFELAYEQITQRVTRLAGAFHNDPGSTS
jgi:ArsR family transcriptional regulator, arsenate/arsenite/antimonite-responsive transcriptional repressor / arsenate reductase (thioredoxin)